MQIESGLDECGILSYLRRNKEIWKPVFADGSNFSISADEFLDQMIVNVGDSQVAEINTFRFFSDVMTSTDVGGIFVTYFIPVIPFTYQPHHSIS